MTQQIDLSRVPPNVVDIENMVLGVMMQYSSSIDTVTAILTADSFYSTSNQLIFDAITKLYAKGRTPDLISVCEQLKSTGKLTQAGDPFGISKLTNSVTSASDIEGKCKKVQEKFILRELIRFGGELVNNSYKFDADAFEALDTAETEILKISNSNLNSEYTNLSTGMVNMIKKIEMMQMLNEDITGVTTGYYEMDRITHGWQEDNLIVIAARPSVGKSSFGLNLARNAAINKAKQTNVGFFSLEMNTNQLVQRIVSAQSEIWLQDIKTGKMDQSKMDRLIKKGVMQLEGANVYIDDTAGLNMSQLRSKARRMVMKDDVGLIIIDYLQLLEGDKSKNKSGNREQEISGISRDLKKLAKQLHIPIIALAQLSREVEKRAVKIPQLSDLRESGAIEQDADMVLFLYRPSVEERMQDADLKRTGTVSIAKHRDGELENFLFDVDDSIQKWTEDGILGKISAPAFRPVKIDYTQSKSDIDAPF